MRKYVACSTHGEAAALTFLNLYSSAIAMLTQVTSLEYVCHTSHSILWRQGQLGERYHICGLLLYLQVLQLLRKQLHCTLISLFLLRFTFILFIVALSFKSSLHKDSRQDQTIAEKVAGPSPLDLSQLTVSPATQLVKFPEASLVIIIIIIIPLIYTAPFKKPKVALQSKKNTTTGKTLQ